MARTATGRDRTKENARQDFETWLAFRRYEGARPAMLAGAREVSEGGGHPVVYMHPEDARGLITYAGMSVRTCPDLMRGELTVALESQPQRWRDQRTLRSPATR